MSFDEEKGKFWLSFPSEAAGSLIRRLTAPALFFSKNSLFGEKRLPAGIGMRRGVLFFQWDKSILRRFFLRGNIAGGVRGGGFNGQRPCLSQRRGGRRGGRQEQKTTRRMGRAWGLCFQAIDAAGDAVFEEFFAEVEKVAQLEIGEAEAGQKLLGVDGSHALDGFEFQENFVIDDEVGAEAFVKSDAVVSNRDRNLAFHEQPAIGQRAGEDGFVNGFEEAGASSRWRWIAASRTLVPIWFSVMTENSVFR